MPSDHHYIGIEVRKNVSNLPDGVIGQFMRFNRSNDRGIRKEIKWEEGSAYLAIVVRDQVLTYGEISTIVGLVQPYADSIGIVALPSYEIQPNFNRAGFTDDASGNIALATDQSDSFFEPMLGDIKDILSDGGRYDIGVEPAPIRLQRFNSRMQYSDLAELVNLTRSFTRSSVDDIQVWTV